MAYKYNPRRITGSFKGSVGGRDFAVQFVGFMDSSAVVAEFDEDAVTKHNGNDGQTSVILNANLGAKVTVMLVQGSPANDDLSDLVPNAKLDYLPVGVLTFEDLNGTTVIKMAEAWISKMAKIEFGKTVTARQWVFESGEGEFHVGGAVQA